MLISKQNKTNMCILLKLLYEESKENSEPLAVDDQMRMGDAVEAIEMMRKAQTIDCMKCEDYKADHICTPCGHMVICNNSKCHELCNGKCPKCDKITKGIYRVRNGLRKKKCVKCNDYPADHVAIPCGHKVSCNNQDCQDMVNSVCDQCYDKILAIQRLRIVHPEI